MVNTEALAANLKRALRGATERFHKQGDSATTFDVTVHDIEFTSFAPPRLETTTRTARATEVIPEWGSNLLLLVDETKLASPEARTTLTYFSLQADGVAERVVDYLDGDVEAALEQLEEVHTALRKLFT